MFCSFFALHLLRGLAANPPSLAGSLPRPWRCPEDDGCPEGMAAVTVVGMGAPQCALVPVCAAANGLGNCPSATPEFPYRSSCRAVAPDVYGCVLDELEAPLEEEVQS